MAAAAGLPLLIAGVRAAAPKPRFFSWQGEVLGAASELTLWHWDEALARRAILKVRHEIERYERIFSLYRDSDVTRLNRDGFVAKPSPDLIEVIDASQRLGTLSNGAFDITVQPLWRTYEEHFWSRSRVAPDIRARALDVARDAGRFQPPAGRSEARRSAARHGDHAQRYCAGIHHRPHRRPAAQRGIRSGSGRSRRVARAWEPPRRPPVARGDAQRSDRTRATTRSRSRQAPARRSSRADNSITSSIRRPARALARWPKSSSSRRAR